MEIDRARAAFGDRVRCGDHTPQLLLRFSRMLWLGPALPKIDSWLQIIEASNPDAAALVQSMAGQAAWKSADKRRGACYLRAAS